MSRIRSLTLLLLSVSIISCTYSFTLDGKRPGKYILEPSTNQTSLVDAGTTLNANMERTLSSMGMLSSDDSGKTLHCSLASYSSQTITTPSLSNSDRYRLIINVTARVTDSQGKELWNMGFSDTGTYSQGGRAEDALEEACNRISLQIARALASLGE